MTREWEGQRTRVLQTHHNKSLAATIELSLASPMFQELGPDARGLLGVVAFFPQGVDENNLKWLFPTVPDGPSILNKFCVLSLTHRSSGFVTMLAPLRDHLCPEDPKSSPLLCAAKDSYFNKLSVRIFFGKPGFEESRWIKTEDVNIEHLLDVFTTIDMDPNSVWDVCGYFMEHIYCHKPRLVVLGLKIETLPDTHPSKRRCLIELSRLFSAVGNDIERKRLLIHALGLCRMGGDDHGVAQALLFLSDANRRLGLRDEGIQQAKEALEICERRDYTLLRAHSLRRLAWLFYADQQPDAAAEAASQSIDLLQVDQFLVCECHRLLGLIHTSKAEVEKATDHFEAALKIASSFGWYRDQFWNHCGLAGLLFNQGRFDDSYAHVERAKLHAVNDPYLMGRAMAFQARLWYRQRRLVEARSEVLCAIDVYEKIGATICVEKCGDLLRDIEEKMEELTTSDKPDPNSELPDMVPLPTVNTPFQAQGTERHH